MSDILCGYKGDRAAMLMAYLYEEIAPRERQEFETHLAGCARCRTELNGLGGVRTQLAAWAPPEPGFALDGTRTAALARTTLDATPEPAVAGVVPESPRWQLPVWAQLAAAMLVLGVSAGLANLDVRYDAENGLNIRTGWSQPGNAANSANLPDSANVASRADLTALEQRLRTELRAPASASPAISRGSATTDADTMRRVRAMVEESERRQQRELALRMAEVLRDVSAQRTADLRRIDQNLGLIEDRTGVAIMKNRQMVDYYIQRASQRQ